MINGSLTLDNNAADFTDFIVKGITLAEATWDADSDSIQYYRIGPVTMAVRFAGNSLIDVIDPALQHTRLDHAPEDITATIYALDAKASGIKSPPDEWPFPVDSTEHFQRVHWNPADGMALASDETRGIWNLYDMRTHTGVYWVRNGKELPSWEAGAPLRILINWLAFQQDIQLVHAAGLSFNGHGILLTGAGGSGKSTTTAAAIQSGWGTAGDDFILVKGIDSPVGHCIYDTIKLTGMALKALPDLARRAVNPLRTVDDKARIHLQQVYPSQLIPELPISVIFSIAISHEKTTEIYPVTRADIMKALAPSTLFMLRTGMKESFTKLSALVKHLPCYHIRLGENPFEAIETLELFLKQFQ